MQNLRQLLKYDKGFISIGNCRYSPGNDPSRSCYQDNLCISVPTFLP